jgi:CsoR family transcriptional regulator, copper-sensing transcriptional repressor
MGVLSISVKKYIMEHSVDQKLKKRALHRAKIIRGQLDGLIRAIDKEEYCPTLLEQSLSIQRSLKSLDAFLLENHLRTHVTHQIKEEGQDNKAVKELVKIFTLSNK